MKEGTLKNFIRIISLVLLVGFFLPCFAVSCAGEQIDVAAVRAAFGYKSSYGTIEKAHLEVFAMLLVPLAVFGLSFVKGLKGKGYSFISTVLGIADFVFWIVFASKVKKLADSMYCSYSVRYGYIMNLLCALLLAFLAVMMFVNKNPEAKEPVKAVPAGWTCACGAVNANEAGFCSQCGSAKPQSWKCVCGAENSASAAFCSSCGAKKE